MGEAKTPDKLVERLSASLSEYAVIPTDPKNFKEFEVFLVQLLNRRVGTDFLSHMRQHGVASAMAWLHAEAVDFHSDSIAGLGWELARRDACQRLFFQLLPLADEYGVSLTQKAP